MHCRSWWELVRILIILVVNSKAWNPVCRIILMILMIVILKKYRKIYTSSSMIKKKSQPISE